MNINHLKKLLDKVSNDKILKGATYSITIKDKTYKTLYSNNTDKFLIAASNIKILTTATTFHLLDSKFRFKTKIYYTGEIENEILKGDLIIKGLGDPTFGSRDFEDTQPKKCFEKILQILKENSIKEIDGNFLVDNSFIDNKYLYSNWSLADYAFYYGAIPNSINFLDNYFLLKQNGNQIVTEEIEAIDSKLLLRECELIEDATLEKLRIYGCPYCEKKKIFLNPNLDISKHKDYRVSLMKPANLFQANFERFLLAKGIIINKNANYEGLTKKELLGIISSPPLLHILRNINFKSNNIFAECVYQVLINIFADRNENFNSYWFDLIRNNNFNIYDGSGLSRTNFLTTDFVTELLMFMFLNKEFSDFFKTLPLLGKEGNVKDYCKNIGIKNSVRLKTGSMSKVRAYSGIVYGTEPMTFSFIFNNYQCSEAELKNISESILKEFAIM